MSADQAGAHTVDGSSSVSMTDQVYALLKEEIIRVERQPGDLLGEAGLAQRFGVSKTPVREALRLLARDGWIVVLPRKGYLVRPLRLGDVREIFAMRLMLEPALASTAAVVTDGDAVAGLRARVDQQTAAHSVRDALAAAREFHVALTDMAGNSRASATLADLFDEVRRLHFLLPSVESHITSQEELTAHQHLVSALADGDGARAAELMREHLNEVSRVLVRGFGGV
jgi:DNA-binding GntR family transcriptional regulator